MSIANVLTLPRARRLFLLKSLFRQGQELIGTKNGINRVFTTPDKFLHGDSIGDGLLVQVYRNGKRELIGDYNDFVVDESGGVGTGYDMVIFRKPPRKNETLLVDYIKEGSC